MRKLFSAVLLSTLGVPAAAQVEVTLTAAPATLPIAPGQTASVWAYDGQVPGPTLRLTEGETLRVRLVNGLPEPTTIHWHGLPVPLGMDGVPGVSRPPVAPGQEFVYEFVAGPPGTYFYHPHVGLQLDRGLYGVLIVDPAGPGDPPYDREHTIVLDDLLPGAPIAGQDPLYAGYLINGATSLGQVPLPVQAGEQVRLRFVNASAGTHYRVVVDGHPMTVTHADGRRVQPVSVQALPVAAGERYDVLISANNPGVWSVAAATLQNPAVPVVRAILAYQGSTQSPPPPGYVPPWLVGGSTLSYAQLASAEAVPPISSAPDRTYGLTLAGGMMSYVWTIGGQAFPAASPLPVEEGEEVRFALTNMSMAPHPMHLHGHSFRLLGTAGGTAAPPAKDTVLVSPSMMGGGSVSFEFVADNPGNWAFHCHQVYHAEAGMMRLVEYVNGDADADGLPDGVDLEPLRPHPVLTTDDLGGGYALGATFELRAQWPAGETVAFFLGPELHPSVPLGPVGAVEIWPATLLGAATSGAGNLAPFPVAVPNLPSLSGFGVGFQALATHPTLPPGSRISSLALVTVY